MHATFRLTTLTTFFYLLTISSFAHAFIANFGLAPDNNQELLLRTLNSAKKNLIVNVYQLESSMVVDTIAEKIREGVNVQILIEGHPVGNMSSEGKAALSAIATAMAEKGNSQNHLYVMTKPDSGEKRRYRFDHAKYIVGDSSSVLISSENFSDSGHPQAGFVGNRGWDTAFIDKATAKKLIEIFKTDIDPSYGDIQPWEETFAKKIAIAASKKKTPKARSVSGFPEGQGNVKKAELITSPNSQDALVNLILSSQDHVDIEEMSLPLKWSSSGESKENPIITALKEKAQEGVRVRVLLNDERTFGRSNQKEPVLKGNFLTVSYLQGLGLKNLEARIVDVQRTGISYIHNKGMIIDDRGALVSSINGTQNSMVNNREVAVFLDSQDAARYFSQAFDFDWENSEATLRTQSLWNEFIDKTPMHWLKLIPMPQYQFAQN